MGGMSVLMSMRRRSKVRRPVRRWAWRGCTLSVERVWGKKLEEKVVVVEAAAAAPEKHDSSCGKGNEIPRGWEGVA